MTPSQPCAGKPGGTSGNPTRPRIGVTLMLDEAERDTHVPRYGMNRTYFTGIRAAGGVPIALLPGPPEEMQLFVGSAREAADDAHRRSSPALDGVCLTGGGDLDPSYFGQPRRPRCGPPDVERDAMEMTLLELAKDTGLPILAICRGMQVLNAAWGGTLIQDIASERPEAQEHFFSSPHPRDHLAHEIRIDPDSRLAGIVGCTHLMTNSIHHQAVDRLGEGLKATAWSPDGLIEAFEPADPDDPRYLLGVQFHPEDMLADVQMRRLFESLVEAASAYARGDD